MVDAAGRYLPWSSPEASCPTTQVSVVTAPQMSAVVRRVVAPLDGRALEDGSCLSVDLQVQSPVTTVENAASTAAAQLPQIWVPDSSLWRGQAAGWSTQVVGSIGTSPVVVATSRASLSALHWPKAVSWAQALDTRTHGIVAPGTTDAAPGMASDAPSLLGLLSLGRTLGPGTRTEQQIAATVLAASRVTAPDMAGAIDVVRKSSAKAPAVLLTDAQAVRNADPDEPNGLVAVAPSGPPAALDYPVLRVDRSRRRPRVHAATDLVVGGAHGTGRAAGRRGRRVRAAGSRGHADDAPRSGRPPSRRQLRPRHSSSPDPDAGAAVPVALAVDTSLSMSCRSEPGLTRIRLAVAGAIPPGRCCPTPPRSGCGASRGASPEGGPTRRSPRPRR